MANDVEMVDSFLLGDRIQNKVKQKLTTDQRVAAVAEKLRSSDPHATQPVTSGVSSRNTTTVSNQSVSLNLALSDSSSDALTDEEEYAAPRSRNPGTFLKPTLPASALKSSTRQKASSYKPRPVDLETVRITETFKSNTAGNVRDLYSEKETLTKENFSLKLRIYHMQQELDSLYGNSNQGEKNYGYYLNENLTLKIEKGELEADLNKYRDLLSSAEGVIRTMQDNQMAQTQSKRAAELALQVDRANKLDNELTSTKEVNHMLQTELDKFKKDHSAFASLSQRVRDLTLELALAKNQRDTASDQAALLKDQNKRYEADALQEAQTKVSSLLSRVDDSEARLSSQEKDHAKKERCYAEQVILLEKELRELKHSKIEDDRRQRRELVDAKRDLDTERVKYERQKRLNDALESRAGSEREAFKAKDNVIASLTDSLSTAKGDQILIKNKNAEIENERNLLAKRIASLQKQVETLRSAPEVKPEQNDELEMKLRVATKKAQELALELSDKRVIQERLERITNQYEKKSRDLGDLQRRYQVLLSSHQDQPRSDLENSAAEIRELTQKIKILEETVKGKNDLIADLRKPTTPRRSHTMHDRLSHRFQQTSPRGTSSGASPSSPYVKRENELLKEQLQRARKMIRDLKAYCQDLLECTQLALASKDSGDNNYPLTKLNIDWQSKFNALKDQIAQKTPLSTPDRAHQGPPSFNSAPAHLSPNISSAKRALFRSQDDLNGTASDSANAEISRLKIQNSMLQKRLNDSATVPTPRSGLLTPPPDRKDDSRVYATKSNFDLTRHKVSLGLDNLQKLKDAMVQCGNRSDYKTLELALSDVKLMLEEYFHEELKMTLASMNLNNNNNNEVGLGRSQSSGVGTVSTASPEEARLKAELAAAKIKLKEREAIVKKTMTKLAKKSAFEDKVARQLRLTHEVLQKAGHNLKETQSQD